MTLVNCIAVKTPRTMPQNIINRQLHKELAKKGWHFSIYNTFVTVPHLHFLLLFWLIKIVI
jgi:hypothetical protein